MVTIAPGVVTIGDGRTPAGLRRETGQNAQEGGGGVGRRQLRPRTGAARSRRVSACARRRGRVGGWRETQAGRGVAPCHTHETPCLRGRGRRGHDMGMIGYRKIGVLTKPDGTGEDRKTPENIGVSACFRGFANGGSRGIRTHDPVIKSHLLYQLSYTPAHKKNWSELRDLNPRHLPWQGSALPLS